jgi:hypothetical protein
MHDSVAEQAQVKSAYANLTVQPEAIAKILRNVHTLILMTKSYSEDEMKAILSWWNHGKSHIQS